MPDELTKPRPEFQEPAHSASRKAEIRAAVCESNETRMTLHPWRKSESTSDLIIKLSRRQRRRLSQIHTHIAADNERAAQGVIDRITHSIGYLENIPEKARLDILNGTREHSPYPGCPMSSHTRLKATWCRS